MQQAQNILEHLSDGLFHSGEALGAELNLTRAGVWKAIQKLIDLGVEIDVVRGKGYRLSRNIQLLSVANINKDLQPDIHECIMDVDIFTTIDSTNDYLLQKGHAGTRCVCLAEQQTAGRGRRGRVWHSPFASNIYCSLSWRFLLETGRLSGLSLVVGIAIVKALQQLGIEGLGLKWPNDIYWQNKKLGGILIEIFGDLAGPCYAVIGFGLNVNMPKATVEQIDQDWVDLQSITHRNWDRNVLVAAILNELIPILDLFTDTGLKKLLPAWQALDVLKNRPIVINTQTEKLTGQALGVDNHGGLRVQTAQGEQVFYGGEVSVRY